MIDSVPNPAPPGPWAADTLALWVSGAFLAFSVAAESAIRHARRNRLERRVRNEARLKWLDALLGDERKLLESLAILRVAATVLLTLAVTSRIGDRLLGDRAGEALSTMGIVLLLLLVGVHGILRQAVHAAPEAVLNFLARPIWLADRMMLPARWLQERLGVGVSRVLGLEARPDDEEAEFRDEILDAVSGGERGGVLETDEREMIENLVEFRDQAVSDVMTPRIHIMSMSVELPLDEAVRAASESGHSRIPLHEGTVDHIVGVLFVKDLLQYWGTRPERQPELRSIMRDAPFIPETKQVSDLLTEFRAGKTHIAIVLDEYGGTAGLVTIEDLVEEIVGEIHDELDHEEAASPKALVMRGEREAEVLGVLRIDELNEALKISLPEDESYDTVGGFLFSRLGRIPRRGDDYVHDNVTFSVLDADERQVTRMRVLVAE